MYYSVSSTVDNHPSVLCLRYQVAAVLSDEHQFMGLISLCFTVAKSVAAVTILLHNGRYRIRKTTLTHTSMTPNTVIGAEFQLVARSY